MNATSSSQFNGAYSALHKHRCVMNIIETRVYTQCRLLFLLLPPPVFQSKKHANKVRLFYMLHPEDGGPPSKRLRPDNPVSFSTVGVSVCSLSTIVSPALNLYLRCLLSNLNMEN